MRGKRLWVISLLPLLASSCGQGNTQSNSSISSNESSFSSKAETSSSGTQADFSSITAERSESELTSFSSENSEEETSRPAEESRESESGSDSKSSESSSSQEDKLLRKTVDVTLVSHFGEVMSEEEYADSAVYDDHWFLQDSSTINYELAVMSAMTGGSSYSNEHDETGNKISTLLEDVGFEDIKKNTYYEQGITKTDSIGAIIGRKSIVDENGKAYTLLGVFPRNAGYKHEWSGDFNLGVEGIHEGFRLTRDEILRFMKSYIKSNGITGDLKVWGAGYSRGAATMNLVGAYLADNIDYFDADVALSPKDLFVYTIATPGTVTKDVMKSKALSVSGPRSRDWFDTNATPYQYSGQDGLINPEGEQYKGIHNFLPVGDYISKLPPTEWGFTRFGTINEMLYGDEKMVDYLKAISSKPAQLFEGGKNFQSEYPIKTFDLQTFSVVETDDAISFNSMIEHRLDILMGMAGNREGFVTKGYAKLLGAIASIFGIDSATIGNRFTDNIATLIKAGVLNYLSYAVDSIGQGDVEGLCQIITQLLGLMGKEIENPTAYTDQQLLSDILDFLINDYQTNDSAKARSQTIKSLIPGPYNAFYTGLMEYAKEKGQTAKTVDGLLALIAGYAYENKEDDSVKATIASLAPLIPSEYVPMMGLITQKAYDVSKYESPTEMAIQAFNDVFESFHRGIYNDEGEQTQTAEQTRYTTLSLINSFVLSKYPTLSNLILNGTTDTEGAIVKEPATLNVLVEEILNLTMPKGDDGERTTLQKAADDSLAELLESVKSEEAATYFDTLIAEPSNLRSMLAPVIFDPGKEYSLAQDIKNAFTFLNFSNFISAAHSHELAISYLKAQLDK